MLTEAADIDETAARPMRPLDQPRADERDDSAGAQDRDDDDKRSHSVTSGVDMVALREAI